MVEDHIAGLNVGSYIAESHRGEDPPQLFHLNKVLPGDVDRTQESNVSDHLERHANEVSQGSLGRDCSAGGPIGVIYPLKIHFKKADWILARRNPIANLQPAAILDYCCVADRHWSRGDLPNVAIGGRLKNEITDLSH